VLIDGSHRGWIRGTLFLFIIATALYVPYHMTWSQPVGPRGGTLMGLIYGGVGTFLMFFAGALGLRRKVRAWNVGRATTWLKGHIWLGLLSYPLILFHAGFRIGGALTLALLVLFTIVIVSGIFGLVVQAIVPRLMTVSVGVETMYEQVATYVGRIRDDAARMVTDVCGALGNEPAAAAADKDKEKESTPRSPARRPSPSRGASRSSSSTSSR
jgi:hypothetical protein